MPAWCWLTIAAYAGLLYGVNLGGTRALTEHEIVVAGIAKQMLRDGSWGGLWIGDLNWLEKPPLPHWLAALALAAIGDIGEAAVRLPSVLEAIGVALIVGGLAACWFGPTIGLLSGLIQASTWYMVKYARLAESDMVLCLLVAAAIASFVAMQRADAARVGRWRLVFWVLLGATNLSKGLLFGAVIILLTCGSWLLSRRDWPGLRRAWSPLGIVAGALVALAWPGWLIARGDGPQLLSWWGGEMGGRLDGSLSFAPPWYYPLNMTWQLLPWTPLLLIGAGPSLAHAWRERDSGDRFFWCWAAAPIAVLSLASHKHHHYIIHALPGLSPVMAIGLMRTGRRIAAMAPSRPRMAGTLCASLFAGVLAVLLLRHAPFLPNTDASRDDLAFLRRVDARVPTGERLIVTGGQPVARHVFYLDRPGRRAEGVWLPADVARYLPPGETAHVVAHAGDAADLARIGALEVLDASAWARFETDPGRRYMLFRLTSR
jgi:4-amino-4-deoxy-L-arabinose transferase-like glycosyltransferase